MSILLRERGHGILLACPPESRLAHEAERRGVGVVRVDVRGYLHPILIRRIARTLRDHGTDLVHCQLSKDIATVVPAVAISGRKIPIILSKRVGSYLGKRDIFHRLTYSRVRRVLAVSDVIHRNVLETTPVPPERVLTLHDAIDTTRFSPDSVDRWDVRRGFGIDDACLLIGSVGRFSPGKGHEELLQATRILREEHKNLHLLVVGEASYGEQQYERKIKTLAVSLGLGENVTFTGYRENVPDLMAAFDVFAFPSHAESFGVVLIEAMAMERPVVSTNCDGVLDIVVDGVTGLYVHPRNPVELASALETLLRDPDLRERMGKAGRRRVLEFFDQEKQIHRLEGIYREVLRESP